MMPDSLNLKRHKQILGFYGFQQEPTFFEGKVDSAWSPGENFLSIATYKSQEIGEVSTFVTEEIKVLHFKCIKINFENRPYLRKGKFWLKTMRSLIIRLKIHI